MVDKSTEGFTKRIIIDWGDGGRTDLSKDGITLYGRNGEIMMMNFKDQHTEECLKLLREKGYTIMLGENANKNIKCSELRIGSGPN